MSQSKLNAAGYGLRYGQAQRTNQCVWNAVGERTHVRLPRNDRARSFYNLYKQTLVFVTILLIVIQVKFQKFLL